MVDSDSAGNPSGVPQDVFSGEADKLRVALNEASTCLRRYLFGMCGDWHEAEDLAQEAMMKAWRARGGFDGRADVKTWIFSIARNHWLDRLRRRRSRSVEEVGADMDLMISKAADPQRTADCRRLSSAIELALAKLPPEQREALAMRESEGLTFNQIAGTLGVPAATVKSRVRYALLRLAVELKPFEAELKS